MFGKRPKENLFQGLVASGDVTLHWDGSDALLAALEKVRREAGVVLLWEVILAMLAEAPQL